jgi:hypothetical protein
LDEGESDEGESDEGKSDEGKYDGDDEETISESDAEGKR